MIRLRAAFTIMEILVVITILGLLAAVAAPKIISNIQIAKAGEAYNMVGTMSKQAVLCMQLHQYTDFAQGCNTFPAFMDNADAANPTVFHSKNILYTLDTAMGGSTMTLEIWACPTGVCTNDFIGSQIDPDNHFQVGIIAGGIFKKKQ